MICTPVRRETERFLNWMGLIRTPLMQEQVVKNISNNENPTTEAIRS